MGDSCTIGSAVFRGHVRIYDAQHEAWRGKAGGT